ncbi:MAG: hypothetical protein H6822_15365 [Planctomycetaceae bacterium]|nr:hypothetical protein [Planctomycetales bacterium]MCB9923561.1 hypothetical protein [Planctomycetaceae bacterium]
MTFEGVRRRWQFSLRSFLFLVLVVGPIVGVFGPIILDAITEWKPPPQRLPKTSPSRPATIPGDSGGYYETGETPLY